MEKAKFRFAIPLLNTICTLKCKYCLTMTPYQMNPRNFHTDDIKRDLDAFFEICGYIEHLDFEGGESLLHPNLSEIIDYAFKFIDGGKCGEIRVISNCTLLPNEDLINTCKDKKIFFILDDYGSDLSFKKNEFTTLLENNKIPYRIDTYHGDSQYHGGWLDLGKLDYIKQNASHEVLQRRMNNCFSAQGGPYIKEGKVFLCHYQMNMEAKGEAKSDEYINLYDETLSVEDKIEKLNTYGKVVIKQCDYCTGFGSESKRISAAEQL